MGKKNLSLLLVFALLLGGMSSAAIANAKPKMKLNKTSLTIKKGKSKTLRVSNPTGKVKWSASDKKAVTLKTSGKKNSSCRVSVKTKTTVKKLTVTAKVGKKKFVCKVTVRTNKTAPVPETNSTKLTKNFEKLEKFIDSDPESEKQFSSKDGRTLVAAKISKKNQEYTFSVEHSIGEERWIDFEILQNESGLKQMMRNRVSVIFCNDDNWLGCMVSVHFANGTRIQADNWRSYWISASNNIIFSRAKGEPEDYAEESEIKLANEMLDTAYPVWQKLMGKYGMTLQDLGFR